ncbi:MAG TPA: hypothetical protein VKL22_07935 [Actinomycetota bacterium]|nr:hypothetical protein [Actinomycetota bacterium]
MRLLLGYPQMMPSRQGRSEGVGVGLGTGDSWGGTGEVPSGTGVEVGLGVPP